MEVRDRVELAYIREGVGGVPLVLVHGWPSTKRIFWRNIAPLAEAGFEVIVPDQRGIGDSPSPLPQPYVDLAGSSRDIHALLTQLGHEQVVAAGGDFGSGVVQDMANRFPGFVIRQMVWNGMAPAVPEAYEKIGIYTSQLEEVSDLSSHMLDNGLNPEGVVAEYDTPEKRRAYIMGYHTLSGQRVWREGAEPIQYTGPGSFDEKASAFMAEPFMDEAAFRASLGFYEGALSFMNAESTIEVEPPAVTEMNTVETLVLYGEHDHIVGATYPARMEAASECIVGPYIVSGSGHFVQFERAGLFNRTLITYCRDLLAG
jgi:pimeloyl-ACP methyl ester carboxylesterase